MPARSSWLRCRRPLQPRTSSPIGARAVGMEITGTGISPADNVRGQMVSTHAVDQDDVAFRVVGAQPQDLPIRRRPVPAARGIEVGELDDDGGAGPASFEHLEPTAVDDESASERFEGGIDALEILDARWAHADLRNVSYPIGGHGPLPSIRDGSPLSRGAAPPRNNGRRHAPRRIRTPDR